MPVAIKRSSVITYNGETLVDYNFDISGPASAADDEDLDWGAIWSGQDEVVEKDRDASSQQQDSAAMPPKQKSVPAIPFKLVKKCLFLHQPNLMVCCDTASLHPEYAKASDWFLGTVAQMRRLPHCGSAPPSFEDLMTSTRIYDT